MLARLRSARALHAAASVAIALAWSGVLGLSHLEGRATLLDRLEAPLLDLRFVLAGHRAAPSDLVIVAIDDDVVQETGGYPLPRAKMAQLVRAVARQEPRAIGLDLLFLEPGPEADDLALAAALGEAKAIIGAAALFTPALPVAADTDGAFRNLPVAERVLWPVQPLRREAGVGLVNIATDNAGTPRHVPLLVRSGVALLPSFPLRVASQAARSEPVIQDGRLLLGPVETHPDLGLNLPLRFYGPRGTVRTVSAASLLRGDIPPDVRDRIVVLGATAVGTADTFATPYDPVLPGVEVLATAVAHLTIGDGLIRDRNVRRLDVAVAIGLAASAGLVMALAPSALGLGFVSFAAVAWLSATLVAFSHGVWLSAAVPLVAMGPPTALGVVSRYLLDRSASRERARAEKALSILQPPALVARIARDPTFLAAPVAQELAVVFVDLSGFTRLSERLGPKETQLFLNNFHALVEDEVNRRGGVVMSFMGDGAMSVFGLPEPRPGDAEHAIEAACGLVSRVRDWLSGRSESREDGINVRVGAHFGEVLVSRLGAADHQHITATGDSVNVASRLMEVAKDLGVCLVVSEDLLAASGRPEPGSWGLEAVRAVSIRGRRQPLRVAHRQDCAEADLDRTRSQLERCKEMDPDRKWGDSHGPHL